jgi:ATP-binding cassette subfamily F protein uup
VAKTLGGRMIVRDFTARVWRGDRVGVIGPNGAGKTTLLRLLIGEIPPDAGSVRRGANVRIAYYDQQREQLDPDRTLFDTIGDGNDTVTVNGRTRHVNAFLTDFLFPKDRARAPVRALSGGERNRLLLARLLTRPANVLVLDEPTNDLDLETLELLESELVQWTGTLLLVSHDRAFLDNVVTSTLVFEGGGRVQEYVGGYEDWVRQREAGVATRGSRAVEASGGGSRPTARRGSRGVKVPAAGGGRLSYNEQRELEALPQQIEALEEAQRALKARIEAPDFYRETPDAIRDALAHALRLDEQVAAAYARWHDLEIRTRR